MSNQDLLRIDGPQQGGWLHLRPWYAGPSPRGRTAIGSSRLAWTAVAAAAFAICAGSSSVRAQPLFPKPGPAAISAVDCSVLSGEPFVCIRNETTATITNITCVGSWGGKTAISLPSGSIRAGTVAIVSFDSGRCNNTITVNFPNRNPRVFNGFDAKTNTILTVSDE